MTIILTGSALVLIVFAIPLAVLRVGIRRQEQAGCLACQPRGLSAALARRLLGLYARLPGDTGPGCESPLVPDRKEPCSS